MGRIQLNLMQDFIHNSQNLGSTVRIKKILGGLFLVALMNAGQTQALFTNGFMGADTAGTFNVATTPGSSQITVNNRLTFYSGTNCTVAACEFSASGPGFTFNPGMQVNISAQSVYLFLVDAGCGTPINSVYITPLSSTNPLDYIFVDNSGHGGCFPVSCSAISQDCKGTAVVNVTLIS